MFGLLYYLPLLNFALGFLDCLSCTFCVRFGLGMGYVGCSGSWGFGLICGIFY